MKLLNSFPKRFATVIFVAIAACLLISFFSCTSTKHVTKAETKYDSTYVETLRDSIRVQAIEMARLELIIRENQFSSVTFDSTRCPKIHFPAGAALLNKDSIQILITDLNNAISGLNNRVKVYADGTIEASGRLKQANYTKETLARTVMQLNRLIDSLRVVNAEKKVQIQTVTITREVRKKTSVFNLWWLISIGLVVGFIMGSKIKLSAKGLNNAI
jgi:hypothetical protein